VCGWLVSSSWIWPSYSAAKHCEMTEYSLFIIVILAKSSPKIKLLLGRKTDAFIPPPKMDSKEKLFSQEHYDHGDDDCCR
jgi:hypothetical protein